MNLEISFHAKSVRLLTLSCFPVSCTASWSGTLKEKKSQEISILGILYKIMILSTFVIHLIFK